MIVQAFLRWAHTANAGQRAKAAGALAHAFLRLTVADKRREQAVSAIIHLLDDPSPQVRGALAQVLACSAASPRAIVLALAEDMPDVACHMITLSPVLTDTDLVDLAARGGRLTRGLIAARPGLTAGAAAAIAEIGEVGEIILLLDNDTANLTRYCLMRIAVRHGTDATLRGRMLARHDLPADVRELLVRRISEALAGCSLVSRVIDPVRLAHVARQSCDAATLHLAERSRADELTRLVAHLVEAGRLTPVFLLQALVSGRIEFFAAAMTELSGLDERRVRMIMATGRRHAMRALYEASGLGRDISEIFVEATLIWRSYASRPDGDMEEGIFTVLARHIQRPADPLAPGNALLDMVERLGHADCRQQVRSFAMACAIAA